MNFTIGYIVNSTYLIQNSTNEEPNNSIIIFVIFLISSIIMVFGVIENAILTCVIIYLIRGGNFGGASAITLLLQSAIDFIVCISAIEINYDNLSWEPNGPFWIAGYNYDSYMI